MEIHEVPPPTQPEKPTREQSIRAILGTLRHNKDVQIDTALTGLGIGVAAATGLNPFSLGLLANVIRPFVAVQLDIGKQNKAVKTHEPTDESPDPRWGVEILKEAWKTGQVQPTLRQHIPSR